MCLNINICKYVGSKLTNMSNFQSFEVVDRGSETKLQIIENLDLIIQSSRWQKKL